MDIASGFQSYQDQITQSLINVTKSASQISNFDLSFHRSTNEKFSQSLSEQNTHLLRLTNKLLKAAAKDSSVKAPSLHDKDDIDDHWRRIVDVVDDLLEKADASLDEFTGALKRLSPARQNSEPSQKKVKTAAGLEQWSQKHIPRPQLHFQRQVNNYETGPWKPLLRDKPHALKLLDESIGTGDGGYKHPYAYEIETFQYLPEMFQSAEPIPFSSPESSQAVFVDTEEAVHEMLKELKGAKEIAVDLEHNDKNSYVGLVCLMQISTRGKDWIVDTLKPWRENLQILNEVFADPKIVKVFHGSTSDIIWLQRDLGLYIVGLFDTFHASNALAFPGRSLKYLLQRFANFEAQKQYQLADWRVRPLPKELLDYARSDTHFLLYIYDVLRNMLLEASGSDGELMTQVLEASKKECLQVYERHAYDVENGLGPSGWLRLLMTRSTGYNNEQFGVFRALHHWRDQKARELDEGEQHVLPNQAIFTWAEEMPVRKQQFFSRGVGRLPAQISDFIPELISIIWKGKEDGKNGPSIYEAIENNGDKVGHMFGRNKYSRRKPEELHRGVGATIQLLNQTGGFGSSPSAEKTETTTQTPFIARSNVSQLFGTINTQQQPQFPNFAIVETALQSVLCRDLVQDQFTPIEATKSTPTSLSVAPSPSTNDVSQVSSKDKVFTIKNRDRKRKMDDAPTVNDATALSLAGQINEANVPTSSANFDAVTNHPDFIRQQSRAEKRAKLAGKANEQKGPPVDFTPFDYTKAESMVDAKINPAVTSPTHSQPLNPFARLLDTGTGAKKGRAGKEQAGKSLTFTS